MILQKRNLTIVAGFLMFVARVVYGDGAEVIIKGGMQSNSMCIANPGPEDKVWVVFAVDGSPEIAARVKKVLDDSQKYHDQNSGLPDNKSVLPVKQKEPNAWGLYDMASCWWEMTRDKAMYPVRKEEIDPVYPARSKSERRCTMGYPNEGSGWTISMREFDDETGLGYSSNKFRVVVEVEGK